MEETATNRLNKTNQRLLFIVMALSFFLILVSAVAGYYIGKHDRSLPKTQLPTPTNVIPSPIPTGSVACTADAKLCLDGSYVSRSGPKCEFAPCPTASPKQAVPTAAPTSPPSSETESVDFGACRSGEGYDKAVGFGSTSLQILRKERSFCVVKITNETEGSVSVSQCSVPKSLGVVSFSIGNMGSDFSSIKKYCNINSTTNINIGN